MSLRVRAFAAVGGLSLVVAGCSGEPEAVEPTTTIDAGPVPSISAPDVSPAPVVTATPRVYPQSVFVATARASSIEVYDEPGGVVTQSVDAVDVLTVPDQTPLTFLVDEVQDRWVKVHLPVRPNGSTGWVLSADVDLISTDLRVEVSLDDFELVVFQGADEVLRTDIGVGRSDRPTPGGVYYIRELLRPPDAGGVYGPYAYGLSGYSPVLDSFNGGDAVIGMHGTNEPDSIGNLVSSGCIRMPNDVITQLVSEVGLPLGAPVYIKGTGPVESA